MRPWQKTLGSTAAATASVAALQTTSPMVLTASPVTFANAMQLSITSAGNVSGITFTVVGTDADGHPQTETITGPNATTVYSTKYFLTVSSVTASGAIGTNTSVGNSALACSSTFIADYINSVASLGYGFTVSTGATLTYKLQHSYDDPFETGLTAGSAQTWFDDATVTAKTAAFNYSMTNAVRGSRMVFTAWTSGTLTGTLVQGLEK